MPLVPAFQQQSPLIKYIHSLRLHRKTLTNPTIFVKGRRLVESAGLRSNIKFKKILVGLPDPDPSIDTDQDREARRGSNNNDSDGVSPLVPYERFLEPPTTPNSETKFDRCLFRPTLFRENFSLTLPPLESPAVYGLSRDLMLSYVVRDQETGGALKGAKPSLSEWDNMMLEVEKRNKAEERERNGKFETREEEEEGGSSRESLKDISDLRNSEKKKVNADSIFGAESLISSDNHTKKIVPEPMNRTPLSSGISGSFLSLQSAVDDESVVAEVARPQGLPLRFHSDTALGPLNSNNSTSRFERFVLVLDGVKEPKNMGLLFQTAKVMGVDSVWIVHEDVDESEENARKNFSEAETRLADELEGDFLSNLKSSTSSKPLGKKDFEKFIREKLWTLNHNISTDESESEAPDTVSISPNPQYSEDPENSTPQQSPKRRRPSRSCSPFNYKALSECGLTPGWIVPYRVGSAAQLAKAIRQGNMLGIVAEAHVEEGDFIKLKTVTKSVTGRHTNTKSNGSLSNDKKEDSMSQYNTSAFDVESSLLGLEGVEDTTVEASNLQQSSNSSGLTSPAGPSVSEPLGICLILGNESHGICQTVREASAGRVTLPLRATSESLNVAVTGGILMAELKQKVNRAFKSGNKSY